MALLLPAVAAAVPLTVTATGDGGAVKVSSNVPVPAPVCLPDRCVYDFAPASTVTLRARAIRPDTHFVQWLDACASVGATPGCFFTMTRPLTVGALFTPVPGPESAPTCHDGVCTDEGPLSQGPKVTVKLRGHGAVLITGTTSAQKRYRARCRGTCTFRAMRKSLVSLHAAPESAFDRFVAPGGYAVRSATYQFSAYQTASGGDPVITANFR